MNIDPRLNEEPDIRTSDIDVPPPPGGGGGGIPDFGDDSPFPFPPEIDPDNPDVLPAKPAGTDPDNPFTWDPETHKPDPNVFPDGTPDIRPPDTWDPDLPTPAPGTQQHWYLRWIESWRQYYNKLMGQIDDIIDRLNNRIDILTMRINNLPDGPERRNAQAMIDSLQDSIFDLMERMDELIEQLEKLGKAQAEWWDEYYRTVRPRWFKRVKQVFKRWWDGRKRRGPGRFGKRFRGGNDPRDLFDSLFDGGNDPFSGEGSYSGIQWAFLLEMILTEMDVGLGGSAFSDNKSDYDYVQGLIDSLYRYFSEYSDPNQQYTYGDIMDIFDGWIENIEWYGQDGEGAIPEDPQDPQGLQGPKEPPQKKLPPTIDTKQPDPTPPENPLGGQGTRPEGEFAKAFARYNNNMQGKGIR